MVHHRLSFFVFHRQTSAKLVLDFFTEIMENIYVIAERGPAW